MKQRNVLVCVAHPDDEVFCSGTILKLTDSGNAVTLVVGTKGEKGSHDPDLSPVAIADLRAKEMQLAASRLAIDKVIQLG